VQPGIDFLKESSCIVILIPWNDQYAKQILCSVPYPGCQVCDHYMKRPFEDPGPFAVYILNLVAVNCRKKYG
jgi:hypothetical protein